MIVQLKLQIGLIKDTIFFNFYKETDGDFKY